MIIASASPRQDESASFIPETSTDFRRGYSLLGGRASEDTYVLADYFQGKCDLKALLAPAAESQIRLGRNAQAIYQDLIDQHAFNHRYNSVKRFVRGLKRKEPERFDRLEFLPGEEAQVDYGQGAPTRCPKSGKMQRPRLFVMTLRYSRRAFRKVVWNSSSEAWARLHEEAFRYFGGCPQYVVLDNLKEGVIKPDIYAPILNYVYGSMLRYYDVVGDPARVRDPDRKGSVENAIHHTQETALKGRTFETIGPWTAKMCGELFKENGRLDGKKIQGVISLSRKYSAARIESACQAAFERHAWSSRAVRQLIEARVEQEEHEEQAKPQQLDLLQAHEAIRPISKYQEFWTTYAQSNPGG